MDEIFDDDFLFEDEEVEDPDFLAEYDESEYDEEEEDELLINSFILFDL
ncbi:MAG: hypothetical protein GX903_00635 [Spirochaetales bacterium]|nr:hypothetical protein [Spirochaetales bacterium]